MRYCTLALHCCRMKHDAVLRLTLDVESSPNPRASGKVRCKPIFFPTSHPLMWPRYEIRIKLRVGVLVSVLAVVALRGTIYA